MSFFTPEQDPLKTEKVYTEDEIAKLFKNKHSSSSTVNDGQKKQKPPLMREKMREIKRKQVRPQEYQTIERIKQKERGELIIQPSEQSIQKAQQSYYEKLKQSKQFKELEEKQDYPFMKEKMKEIKRKQIQLSESQTQPQIQQEESEEEIEEVEEPEKTEEEEIEEKTEEEIEKVEEPENTEEEETEEEPISTQQSSISIKNFENLQEIRATYPEYFQEKLKALCTYDNMKRIIQYLSSARSKRQLITNTLGKFPTINDIRNIPGGDIYIMDAFLTGDFQPTRPSSKIYEFYISLKNDLINLIKSDQRGGSINEKSEYEKDPLQLLKYKSKFYNSPMIDKLKKINKLIEDGIIGISKKNKLIINNILYKIRFDKFIDFILFGRFDISDEYYLYDALSHLIKLLDKSNNKPKKPKDIKNPDKQMFSKVEEIYNLAKNDYIKEAEKKLNEIKYKIPSAVYNRLKQYIDDAK